VTSAPIRFKPRTYLHFDLPLSKSEAEALACNPNQVATHAFYPFLGYTVTTEKIQRELDGSITRKMKEREIKIAAHRDAAIYAHYGQLLTAPYEVELKRRGISRSVTAFRSVGGGCNIDFAGEVFDYIERHRPCVALAYDLEKFFDTLDHQVLKERWASLLGTTRLPTDHFAIYRSLSQFAWVARDNAYELFGISPHNPKANKRRRLCNPDQFRQVVRAGGHLKFNPAPGQGIPQGSPISALLSNIYMLEFDTEMHAAVREAGGLYRRYCDDIMLIVPQAAQAEMEGVMAATVARAKVRLNIGKTDIVSFPFGSGQTGSGQLQYLGFTYDGTRKLLRLGSLGRYYGKMRAAVSLAKQTQRKHNRIEADKGLPLTGLKTRKLYTKYSYLIHRRNRFPNRDARAQGNFLTYAYRSAEKLNAPGIKRQIRNHWIKLQEEIRKPIHGQLRKP
jgi:RNA-directed DNA polymerase